jgi:hypothetical protein
LRLSFSACRYFGFVIANTIPTIYFRLGKPLPRGSVAEAPPPGNFLEAEARRRAQFLKHRRSLEETNGSDGLMLAQELTADGGIAYRLPTVM